MNGERPVEQVEALRRAFDERFAAPVASQAAATVRLLLIVLGGARFALRIAEIAGLHEVPRLVRIPGGSPMFRGLAGVRGRVVPVFDLAALLGAETASPRRPWIVLAGERERLGLLVAEIEGHVDVPAPAIHAAVELKGGGRAACPPHVVEVAEVRAELVPVASVASVLRALAQLARGGAAGGGL